MCGPAAGLMGGKLSPKSVMLGALGSQLIKSGQKKFDQKRAPIGTPPISPGAGAASF